MQTDNSQLSQSLKNQQALTVNFKKLVPHAFEPEYAKEGDAGMDLRCLDFCDDHDHDFVEYGTGIALEIPQGYVGLLFPRSSISKTPFILANCVGVIDSGYRGEVKFRFRRLRDVPALEYEFGDKIGQLIIMPYPTVKLNETKELSNSERGDGGFGSSGY